MGQGAGWKAAHRSAKPRKKSAPKTANISQRKKKNREFVELLQRSGKYTFLKSSVKNENGEKMSYSAALQAQAGNANFYQGRLDNYLSSFDRFYETYNNGYSIRDFTGKDSWTASEARAIYADEVATAKAIVKNAKRAVRDIEAEMKRRGLS